jgi:hypothetical protein
MWAHPYLQAVNLIHATKQDPHVWTHDGDMSETFGLEPNFGCCTANFNQGWPKLISQVVMALPFAAAAGQQETNQHQGGHEGGAAVTLLIPANATLENGATVRVDTAYPFEDTVRVSCVPAPQSASAFPLWIRVPGWATKATLNGKAVVAGSFAKESCVPGGANLFTLALSPEIVVEEWAADKHGGAAPHAAYSVTRGPLLYSLPIDHNFTTYGRHFGSGDAASNDYYLEATEAWNFALELDPQNPGKTLIFVPGAAYATGAAPFNRTGPLSIKASAKLLPGWGMSANSAAPPPQSPACASAAAECGVAREVTLVPHGYTELRIGEFPLA